MLELLKGIRIGLMIAVTMKEENDIVSEFKAATMMGYKGNNRSRQFFEECVNKEMIYPIFLPGTTGRRYKKSEVNNLIEKLKRRPHAYGRTTKSRNHFRRVVAE